ncbi:hypothetical protein [Anaerococcus hydrogenalis]|jgi:hypothetical protein|uniref:hypothetical protein n=1 Tax=Anaerococcus hydrogenalis TaxID=33029 RepID=UPI002905494C|nr:hypothetical protein [Anaerococcus hydrogenalis]MDU1316660.1 hypothetical protein [Anaerococcus hydrogenalis]
MSDYKILVNSYDDYTLAVEVGKLANNLEELKMKISNVKKENGNTEITFSDGHKINIKDGDTPTIDKNGFWVIGGQSTGVKARAELSFKELSEQEKLSIKGDKGDPLRWEDLTYEQKASLKGKTGDTGQASRVLKTEYDSEGNTLITFNDQTTAKINRGKTGQKGDKGDSTTTSSITKSGLTTTVKFTDGKSMQIQDGKSVKVDSYRILDDGNTEITFTDGKKATIKKGQDGTVKFDELTEEQINMLKVEVVDDLETGGSDKALSAEQGKKLFRLIERHHPPKPLIMTAVIDQANSNPLTCITYEDDAKMMEKGSPEWNDFFQSQLVLFKDGKEVRELEDSELNDLKPDDGDVMVRFPRKGLRIKTVGEKVYVSMTNASNDSDFKYYAHSRGDSPRDAFYLGAYLGFEESGKLRSITGKAPTGSKTIGDFRTIAQANGAGYEQLAFYQWTFLQAMYVLKYGNLDSRVALGKGDMNTSNHDKVTGETNGKGMDFGTASDTTKVRFQWVEDFFGTKEQWLDGVKSNNNKIWINNDKFNDGNNGYKSYEGYYVYKQNRIKSVIGDSERGFIPKSDNGSSTTYYCDYGLIRPTYDRVARVGGRSRDDAGAFYFFADVGASAASLYVGARLMFL